MTGSQSRQPLNLLIEEHSEFLYRFAYRLSGSAADAEDLVQQAFLTAHAKLDQLREAEKARAWLVAVVRNAHRKTCRRERPAPFSTVGTNPEPVTESDLEQLLNAHSVQDALNELPEEFRVALVLYYFNDLSYKDIAELLDTPIGTVMSRLSRGKAQLRQRLLPDFANSSPEQISPELHVRDDEEPAMDCGIARERLDAARSDPQDREDSELQTAFAHLDECPACAEAYEFHRAFDRRVGEIVRQIDVPADLQSRLRESLASHATLPQPEMPRADDIRSSRRALLLSASAATLLMAVGVSWYVGHREAAPLTAATVLEWWGSQLTQTKNFDPSTLPAFDGGFDLAAAGDPRWLRLSQQEPRGADIDNDGRHDAAVVAIPGGFVVVLPAGRVTDPPSAGAAGSASAVYTPALHVAWTFKNSMHVCFLPGGSPRQLQQLLNKVYRSAA